MTWKEFALEAFRIYRGTLVSKVVLALLLVGGGLLGAGPWWSPILTSILENYLSISVADPSASIGLGLMAAGVLLTLIEMLRLYRIEVAQIESNKISEELQSIHADDAFIRIRTEAEKSALSILRRLIDIHFRLHGNEPALVSIGPRVQYGDEEAVLNYVDSIVVGSASPKAKLDFFTIVGDATGHPLAYKFVRVYEALANEANSKGRTRLICGTPLFQAFSNITHESLKPLRTQAYWEAYV